MKWIGLVVLGLVVLAVGAHALYLAGAARGYRLGLEDAAALRRPTCRMTYTHEMPDVVQ